MGWKSTTVLIAGIALALGFAWVHWSRPAHMSPRVSKSSGLGLPSHAIVKPLDHAAAIALTAHGIQIAGPPDPQQIRSAQDAAAAAASRAQEIQTRQSKSSSGSAAQ